MYEYYLFDLDGTITDTGLGITNSVIYALGKFGIEVDDRTAIYKFIGPPLHVSFREFCGFDEEKSRLAIEYYREYYRDKGLFENTIYPGIEYVLKTLKKQGKKIMLATSKPEEFAIKILKGLEVYKYFDFCAGANMDGSRSKKSDVIKYALENLGVTDTAKALMIGDREYDIYGAKEFNIDSVGVLFGYGSKEEFVAAGATYIVEKAEEILELDS